MVEKLKNYIIEHDYINKTKECFWTAFNNWKGYEPERYAEKFENIKDEELEIKIQGVGLRLSPWPECCYNHVVVTLKIYHPLYKQGEMATYNAWFSLSDEQNDDDFLEV